MGSKSPQHTLVQYGDLQCPDTAAAELELQEIMQDMDEAVRLVFRHFPLTDMHPAAYRAAEASEAAGAQGKFWEMRRMLLENQDHLDAESMSEYARELRLDVARFDRDVQSHAFAGKIDVDIESALRSGVEASPTFFLDGIMLDPGQDLYAVMESLDEPDEDE
jgi:protein-disulfide isomerase